MGITLKRVHKAAGVLHSDQKGKILLCVLSFFLSLIIFFIVLRYFYIKDVKERTIDYLYAKNELKLPDNLLSSLYPDIVHKRD